MDPAFSLTRSVEDHGTVQEAVAHGRGVGGVAEDIAPRNLGRAHVRFGDPACYLPECISAAPARFTGEDDGIACPV
jgi:DNA-binding transcriptional LysR family regulator